MLDRAKVEQHLDYTGNCGRRIAQGFYLHQIRHGKSISRFNDIDFSEIVSPFEKRQFHEIEETSSLYRPACNAVQLSVNYSRDLYIFQNFSLKFTSYIYI